MERSTISDERVWGIGDLDHPLGDWAGTETLVPEINRWSPCVSLSETNALKRFVSLRGVSNRCGAITEEASIQRQGERPEWTELGGAPGYLAEGVDVGSDEAVDATCVPGARSMIGPGSY